MTQRQDADRGPDCHSHVASHHKEALRQKQRELRTLLREWDPIGVYGPESTGPPDEYDCLLGLVGKLRDGTSAAEVGRFLTEELADHFGLDPTYAHPMEFAERLHAWYWKDPLPGSVHAR